MRCQFQLRLLLKAADRGVIPRWKRDGRMSSKRPLCVLKPLGGELLLDGDLISWRRPKDVIRSVPRSTLLERDRLLASVEAVGRAIRFVLSLCLKISSFVAGRRQGSLVVP